VVELIRGLSADRVRANLERVRGEIWAAGRDASEVEILAAVKYVPDDELEVLAEAGIELVGENASDSALRQLERYGDERTEILVEVNVAGEEGKAGVAPEELRPFLERSPVRVVGLTTMPPVASDPEQSRPYFAALRRLADRLGLRQLSMGTSQDYVVAVQEGATIIRLGTTLYRQSAS